MQRVQAPAQPAPVQPATQPPAASARPARAEPPPAPPEPIPQPAAAARLMRELPEPAGEGTRRFMARGAAMRRRALSELEGALTDAQGTPLTERMQEHLARTLSLYDLDRDVDRAAGGVFRRIIWGIAVLAIAIGAWLGFHVVIGSP